jgi:hypothetical protein
MRRVFLLVAFGEDENFSEAAQFGISDFGFAEPGAPAARPDRKKLRHSLKNHQKS